MFSPLKIILILYNIIFMKPHAEMHGVFIFLSFGKNKLIIIFTAQKRTIKNYLPLLKNEVTIRNAPIMARTIFGNHIAKNAGTVLFPAIISAAVISK